MITTTNRDPYALAERLGVAIVYRKLAGGLHAYWDGQQIIIDPRLTQRQERCALTHDLMHVQAGDATYVHAMKSPAIESKRDLQAAEYLIDPAEFHKVAAIYPDDPVRVARELGVTDRLLNAWARARPMSIIGEDLVA
ncbi:ImmA/IrrE family metallo-endopeptidase [Rothia sp. P4278]|uniref:ImmA/IrrE family metallo-endopeptidase n=1 Tax=Rothia sp. P4278 TaxID=3402658 RepID=UPI003AE492F4